MAAHESINPHQLKMFMSSREISGYVDSYNDFAGQNPERGKAHPAPPHETFDALEDEVMYEKHDASVETGMDASIGAEGVKYPLGIYHYPKGGEHETMFVSGHHRLLSQSQHDPDRLMPVLHGPVVRGSFRQGGTYRNNPRGE